MLWYCKRRGHDYKVTGTKITPPARHGCLYRRRLKGVCKRCGHTIEEDRWAFNPRAGALEYLEGRWIDD